MTLEEWRDEHSHDDCWICGRSLTPYLSDCMKQDHHIASGVHRKDVVANLVVVCQNCHLGNNGLHDYSTWPIARQLALKRVMDFANYDRVSVNLLRGRQPEAITEAEVDKWARRMSR